MSIVIILLLLLILCGVVSENSKLREEKLEREIDDWDNE